MSFVGSIYTENPKFDLFASNVSELVRSTTITNGNAKVHTIEHVFSALVGCGIDNAEIELDASEPPIMDGSARPFVNLILEAEPVEQEEDRKFIELKEPVSLTSGNRSIIALPHDGFESPAPLLMTEAVMYSTFPLILILRPTLPKMAPARTFTIYEDIEELLKDWKDRGGSLDSAIVIKGDKILSKEPLRFEDEFVRHKILDIVGDFSLLGKPLKAHIIAVRPGHSLNSNCSKLHEVMLKKRKIRITRFHSKSFVFLMKPSWM